MTGQGWGFCLGLPDTQRAIVTSAPKEKSYPALFGQESQHCHSSLYFPTPEIFTEDNYMIPLLALDSFDESLLLWSDLSL